MAQKPGVKTTEFWLTLVKGMVGPVLAVLFASGALQHEVPESDVQAAIDQIAGAVVTLIGLFVSGSAVKKYAEGRASVKAKEAEYGSASDSE